LPCIPEVHVLVAMSRRRTACRSEKPGRAQPIRLEPADHPERDKRPEAMAGEGQRKPALTARHFVDPVRQVCHVVDGTLGAAVLPSGILERDDVDPRG
jgi:hypothetical protein